MHDTSNVPRDSSTFEYDDPSHVTLVRPETPLPDDTRTLHRTTSYASIETLRPRANKGVRRRIVEIAEGLKQKSTKKKEDPSLQDILKAATLELAWDSKNGPARKALKRERKAKDPLQNSLRQAKGGDVHATHDRLHSGVPSALDVPWTSLLRTLNSLLDGALPLEDDLLCRGGGLPNPSVGQRVHVTMENQDAPLVIKAGIEDVQLEIRSSEPDITIWDGLEASQHVFMCRLYLRCMTHPYDSVAAPDVRRIDMACHTHPAGSRYARPPAVQATYKGRSRLKSDGSPNVNLGTGVHIDKFWRTVLDDDGTWGWYKEVFVPLSPRLFDKMDYREFKLVSQVWMGENCVEGGLTFGISMLLRGVDMR